MGNRIMMAENPNPLNTPAPIRIIATKDIYAILVPADSTQDIILTFSAGSEIDLSKSIAHSIDFPLLFSPPGDLASNGLHFTFDSVGSIFFPAHGKIKVNGSLITPARQIRKIK